MFRKIGNNTSEVVRKKSSSKLGKMSFYGNRGYCVRDKICKTRENSNFLKTGKMVISVKIRNFSRSWMMKRTSPLESSREI